MNEPGLIGVDTGGTFTDCVLFDHGSGRLRVAKVPSQPERPHAAILDGIHQLGDGAVAVGSAEEIRDAVKRPDSPVRS